MLRIRRAVAAGLPHHVIQRGNNRENVFFDTKDRKQYLSLLKKYSAQWDSPILAYCLMSNHLHLLTKPNSDEALYKMMQGLTLCYTQYINRTYQRSGRLWESRYHSCIVDNEKYLWAVSRYVEQNPVRAVMLERPEDYPYSSAREHVTGAKDSVLGEELFGSGQRADYIHLLQSGLPEKVIERLRYVTRTGRPFGKDGFVAEMEKKLELVQLFRSSLNPS